MISEKLFKHLMDGGELEYAPQEGAPSVRVSEKTSWITASHMRHGVWRYPPVERRDWKGALEWLKDDKLIRRAEWPAEQAVVPMCGTIEIQRSRRSCGTIFEIKDFEATDWELV